MKFFYFVSATELSLSGLESYAFSTAIEATSYEHARNKFAVIYPFATIQSLVKE